MVDAAQGRAGRYDPHQDDPFPLPGGLPRMVLAFYEAATLVVHLEQRPAVARFRAQGQINATPGGQAGWHAGRPRVALRWYLACDCE